MTIALTCTCGNTFAVDGEWSQWADRLIACPACESQLSVATGECVPRHAALGAGEQEPAETSVLPEGDILLRLEARDEVVQANGECVAEENDDGREIYDFSREHGRLLASAPAAHRFFAAIGVIPLANPASCLAYGAGNEWALAGCGMNVQILYMKAGEKARMFHKHEALVTAVAVAPDGRSALTGDVNGNLLWWELANGAVNHRQRAHVGAVLALAISADGLHAVSGGADRATRLWDLACGCHAFPIAGPGIQAEVTATAFSTDGHYFLAGDAEGHVDIWATQTGKVLQGFQTSDEPIACVRCHDGIVTAVAAPPVCEMALHPRVFRWDLQTGRPLACFANAVEPMIIPLCVGLDREGWRLLIAGRAPNVPFHNVPVLADVLTEMRDGVRDFFRVRTDPRCAASSLEVLSLQTGARLHVFPEVSGGLHRLAVSPDNTRILAASTDGKLHVFAMPEV